MIRKFIFFDVNANHNKEWIIEFDPTKSYPEVTTKWGRVGSSYQTKTKTMSLSSIYTLINDKLDKGYHEIELATVSTINAKQSTGNAKFDALIDMWNYEAGVSISSYLSTTIDQLSLNHIQKARTALNNISQKANLVQSITDYYNLIPTKLSNKLNINDLIAGFDIVEQDTRLQQLEAAIMQAAPIATGNPLLQFGQIELEELDASIIERIVKKCKDTGCRDKTSVYGLTITPERQAYEKETLGSTKIMSLFHGTSAKNVRHVLRSGLIIPQYAANGSRFGRGIYFSDKYQRSRSYVNGQRSQFMFLVDVKIGKPYVSSGSNSSYTRAPLGYDSVQGTGSWSGLGDEFIVYLPSQQTIRAIIHIE